MSLPLMKLKQKIVSKGVSLSTSLGTVTARLTLLENEDDEIDQMSSVLKPLPIPNRTYGALTHITESQGEKNLDSAMSYTPIEITPANNYDFHSTKIHNQVDNAVEHGYWGVAFLALKDVDISSLENEIHKVYISYKVPVSNPHRYIFIQFMIVFIFMI